MRSYIVRPHLESRIACGPLGNFKSARQKKDAERVKRAHSSPSTRDEFKAKRLKKKKTKQKPSAISFESGQPVKSRDRPALPRRRVKVKNSKEKKMAPGFDFSKKKHFNLPNRAPKFHYPKRKKNFQVKQPSLYSLKR